VPADGGGRLLSENPARAPASPFRGLQPFGDSDADGALFAGRDEEIELVVANLRAARLTILYGPSGVGKSSLLHAGVVRRIRAQARAAEATGAPAPAILLHDEWAGDPGVALARRIDAAAGGETDTPPPALDEAIERWGARRRGVLLLIFDQFEEYLRLHAEGQPDSLDELLPEIVDHLDLRVHVLISLRDDALSELDRFEGRIPNLFENYLRLPQMTSASAREAIEKPIAHVNVARAAAERAPIEVEPGLVDEVLGQLRDPRLASIDGDTATGPTATDGAIEPAFLQLVMQRLWNADAGQDPPVLRRETLVTLGGAAAIVRGHLDGAMSSLTAAQRDVAEDVFGYLVTPSGAKIRYSADDLAAYADRSPAAVSSLLNALCRPELRIVRRVPAPAGDDTQGFEIFHDVLAGPVRGWALRMRSARLERRNARLATAMAALVAIAVGLIVQIADSGPLHRLELRTVDERFALRGGHAPDPRILIVGRDDRTPKTSLTRAAQAKVLGKVAAGRPAVIVEAFEFGEGGNDDNGGEQETAQLQRAIAAAAERSRVLLATSRIDNDGHTTLFGDEEPATRFFGADAAYGDFLLDDDKTIRRIEYEGRQRGDGVSGGLRTIAVQAAKAARADVTPSAVPEPAWIDFAGGRGRYPHVSFRDVLSNQVNPATFRDRIVVIGNTSAAKTKATAPTAVDREGRMTKGEVHANAIATMRAGQPLRDVSEALDIALILGLALLASAFALRFSLTAALALCAATGPFFLLVAQLAFNGGWVVAVVAPLLALVVAAAANPLMTRAVRHGGRVGRRSS